LAGKLSLARWTGRPVAWKNCLQITTRFRFLAYSALFFSSLKYNEHAVKGKKKHLVHRGGKGFLVIMEGEGDSRPPGQMRDICWCK